jgi:uncharacterized protein YlzI (FlbEa/FlbD family)
MITVHGATADGRITEIFLNEHIIEALITCTPDDKFKTIIYFTNGKTFPVHETKEEIFFAIEMNGYEEHRFIFYVTDDQRLPKYHYFWIDSLVKFYEIKRGPGLRTVIVLKDGQKIITNMTGNDLLARINKSVLNYEKEINNERVY